MTPLALGGFFVFGVLLVLVGANQAALAQALRLDLAATGLLGAALSLGIAAGVLASGPIVDRRRRRPLFAAAGGVGALALGSVGDGTLFAQLLVVLFVAGACAGSWEIVLNAVIAELHGEHAARPLSFVHAAATLGAVVGAPAIAWLTAAAGFPASFRALALGFLLVSGWGALGALDAHRRTRAQQPVGRLSTAILPFAGVAGCYVGVETAVTLFAVPWVRDALGLDPARGVRAISAFYLGLLLGRLAFVLYRGVPGRGLLVAGGMGSALLLGACAWLRVPQPELVLAGVGFALGIVFPLFVALTAQRFPEARGTATGVAIGAGAGGGFVVPWLTGQLGDRVGIELAWLSLAGWCLLLAAFARLSERGRPASPGAAR